MVYIAYVPSKVLCFFDNVYETVKNIFYSSVMASLESLIYIRLIIYYQYLFKVNSFKSRQSKLIL